MIKERQTFVRQYYFKFCKNLEDAEEVLLMPCPEKINWQYGAYGRLSYKNNWIVENSPKEMKLGDFAAVGNVVLLCCKLKDDFGRFFVDETAAYVSVAGWLATASAPDRSYLFMLTNSETFWAEFATTVKRKVAKMKLVPANVKLRLDLYGTTNSKEVREAAARKSIIEKIPDRPKDIHQQIQSSVPPSEVSSVREPRRDKEVAARTASRSRGGAE